MKKISGLKSVLLIVVILSFVPNTGLALSIWFPKFGKPIVCKDHIAFTSVDKKRLICIDLTGKKIWEKKYSKPIIENQRDDDSIVIQVDRRVIAVDVPTGKETPMFETRSRHETVHFDQQSGLAWSRDDRKKHRMFRMLDPTSGAIRWEQPDVEFVAIVLERTMVCLTGKQIGTRGEYALADAAVEAFEIKTGKKIWRFPLSNSTDIAFEMTENRWRETSSSHSKGYYAKSWVHAVYVAPYVVILDGDARLVCLQAEDGEIANEVGSSVDFDNRIPYIATKDGLLAYKTHESPPKPDLTSLAESIDELTDEELMAKTTRDFDQTRQFLHFVSLPDFKE